MGDSAIKILTFYILLPQKKSLWIAPNGQLLIIMAFCSLGLKCTRVEIHSFWSFIRDGLGLEWNSTPEIVDSTLKREIQTSTILWNGFHHKFGVNSTSKRGDRYSLNKKEWICSLFKEWILEKSDIRVNLEWTFVLFTHFGVTTGITRNPWVIPVVTPKWVKNTNVHSKFTPNSL